MFILHHFDSWRSLVRGRRPPANIMIQNEDSCIIFVVKILALTNIFIHSFTQVYNRIAVRLTDWECPRTRTEYEDSFIIKMFLFQFFNTYSSIIYVAFLKSDAIVGSPGNYRRFGSTRYKFLPFLFIY